MIDKDYDRVPDLAREGDVFDVIAPVDNLEKVYYYLLRCTRSKSMLMQEFKYPSNYTYAMGSMVLMGYFFAEVRKCKEHIFFQDYESDVLCAQYNHLVIASRLQLKAVKSRKNSKHRQCKLLIEDHNAILDNMPLEHFI